MRWWHVGLVVLACLAVYSNTFENDFHVDDSYRVQDNPGVQQFWPPWRHFTDPTTSSHLPRLVQYRPLLPLSLSVNYAIAGDSLVGYHIGNLLFQIVASVLLYFLARELMSHWSKLTSSPHAPLFVALLFAVHPVSGVPVNYICGRDLSMMQMFMTASLLCYVRMRRLGENPVRWGLCLSLLLLALLAKKNAVVFPALVVLFELLFTKGSYARLWRCGLFVAVVGALLLFVRFGLDFSDMGNIVSTVADWREYGAHELQHHVFHYLRNFAWPFPIRQSAIDEPETWKMIVGGACAVVSWGLAAYWWRRAPLLAFCVLGYQASIALTSSVIPLHDEIVAYRAYASGAFLFLGVVVLLQRLPAVSIVLSATVIYVGSACFWLNFTWKDEKALWGHSVAYGTSARGHYNMAQAIKDDTDPAKRRHFDIALEMNPTYVVGHIGLAMLQLRTGDYDGCVERMNLAVELGPNKAQTHYWFAVALRVMKRYPAAAVEGEKAAKLQPRNAMYQYEFAKTLQDVERFPEAADAAEKAAALQPGNAVYQYYAGERASVAGRFQSVVAILEPLHARTGGHQHSGFLLAYAYHQTNDRTKAIRYMEEFLAGSPSIWFEHGTLAAWYRAAGNVEQARKHQQIYDRKGK